MNVPLSESHSEDKKEKECDKSCEERQIWA